MDKILKPYTIIPPHLYVSRNADRQLRDIISDMGRPGYVLVSRQMGKTNLLLNAKRELGNEFDKFIYVDLSNTFEDEQSCFQNIIDLAIETNENDYTEASIIINSNRKNQNNIPPHKQHTNELRVLLNHTKGKLIIILDEIDALTKTNYSDKIFAQIRSVYFSRVNFPELERLTYILSGVVEPSEIIKDPKISPFNIGEKIFLNDFSKAEFLVFLKKAKLDNLGNELIDRIYYWTNGNPRMTWDLCSEIENNLLETKHKDQIDEIVQKLYLTAFDKPPIDNIREIVISDKSIRDAIVEIDYNKGKQVADNIKSKLYLAGIINYEENDIKIKNRIIKNALNKNWLDSIKEQEQGLLKTAIDLIEKQKYNEAIEIYEKFMSTNEFPDKESETFAYYNLGIAFYKDFQFQKSIDFLSKTNFTLNEYPKLVYRIKNIIGLCHYYLDEFDKSIESFKFVIDQSYKDELYGRALLNYGSACINSGDENLMTEAVSIFKKVAEEENFDKNFISDISVDELKSISNYNLGLLYSDLNPEASKLYFQKALETNKVEIKPIFYFNLINSNIIEDGEKVLLLNGLIDCIIDNKILPIEKDPERPLDIDDNVFEEILLLAFSKTIDGFERLMNYALDNVYKAKDHVEILYELVIISLNSKKRDIGNEILEYCYLKYQSVLVQKQTINNYKILKLLSYFIKANKNINYSNDYLRCFTIKRQEPIDFYDFDIVSYTISELLSRGEYLKVEEYLKLFYNLKSDVDESHLINYLVLDFMNLQLKIITKNYFEAEIIAKNILIQTENLKHKNDQISPIGEKGIENIESFAKNYLNPNKLLDNIKSEVPAKNYMRNDKIKVQYMDGRLIEDKYKKLENDIINQRCKIIEN